VAAPVIRLANLSTRAKTIQFTAKGMNGDFKEDPENISEPR
jgi:hypothetical protein